MIILGIETSCDETAAAVVQDGHQVLSSVIASQVAVHAPFGGIIPEIAAREHLSNIHPIVQQALNEAKLRLEEIDALAVTQGPGLVGSLLIGSSYVKGLGLAAKKKVIPVDHVHAHIHGALLSLDSQRFDKIFPALALVISGGHTNLYYLEHATHFRLLAYSLDDACGEAFDKVAKVFGFDYPGGPAIEECAKKGRAEAFDMPKMLMNKNDLMFSYSGLKTAVINRWRNLDNRQKEDSRADLCAAFQRAAFEQIVRKIETAMTTVPGVKTLVIAGGVAANQELIKMLAQTFDQELILPPLRFCSDNAAMVAALAFHQERKAPKSQKDYVESLDFTVYSRYPFLRLSVS